MNENAQLLAHAGAPSSRQDDDRYRAQMQAYLDLGLARTSRVNFALEHAVRGQIGSHAPQGLQDDVSQRRGTPPDRTVCLDDTQLAYTTLHSPPFLSAPMAAGSSGRISQSSSPSPAQTTPVREPVVDRHDETILPASLLLRSSLSSAAETQSSYLLSPFAIRFQARPVSRGDRSVQQMPVGRGGHEDVRADCSADSEKNSITSEPISEMPTSYSLSDTAPASPRRCSPPPPQCETSLGNPTSSAVVERSTHQTAQRSSKPTIPASTSVQMPSLTAHESAAESGYTTVVAARKQHAAAARPSSDGPSTSSGPILPLEILPPGPETGTGRFHSHVTAHLQRLIDNADICQAYQPVRITRAIDLLERGYWLIPSPDWPMSKSIAFWTYLQSSIGTGKAGWGVWCSRGDNVCTCGTAAATASKPLDQHDPVSDPNSDKCLSHSHRLLGPTKVYCWGELVPHIYLLLYVASSSRVRKLGLQWFDANGTVIVEMR